MCEYTSLNPEIFSHSQGEAMTRVGQSVPRIDAIDKVTSRAAYVGDLEVPSMVLAFAR